MGKALDEAPITTRNARKALPPGTYKRGIDTDIHLLYRKGVRAGGKWVVRYRAGKDYKRLPLGSADDILAEGNLSFEDAVKAAREAVATARHEKRIEAAGPVITVGMAVQQYADFMDAQESKRRGRPIRSKTGHRLHRNLLGQGKRGKSDPIPPALIAAKPMHELEEDDLLAWRATLPGAMKPTTKQRLINDVKAGLNAAYAENRKTLPATLPAIIKFGLRNIASADDDEEGYSVARENQILADADIRRLVATARDLDHEEGWEGDLYRLVLILASTGTRFIQATRIRVQDCQVAARRLMVPKSRKGGKNKKAGFTAVPVGPDVMDELVSIKTGRRPDEILLERWRKAQRKGSIEWFRDKRGPWQDSAELRRPWGEIVKRAGLPEAVPYCFRHSSIVKMLKANKPIRLVASVHDTSIGMIERHYSAFIVDALEDVVRDTIIPLVPQDTGAKVVKLNSAAIGGKQ